MEIKSKGDFNRVRTVLAESGLVTLAAYAPRGQSYILSGNDSMPSFNPDAYVDEVIKRKIGMLNSNSVNLCLPSNDDMAKIYNKITRILN